MALTSSSSARELLSTLPKASACSAVRGPNSLSSKSSLYPLIMLRGVRISWDMVAKNSSLRWLVRSSFSTSCAFSSAMEAICAIPRAIHSCWGVKDCLRP